MRHLKYLFLLALLALPAAYAQAQVSIGVQIGPSYGFYNPPPVCPYGFYSYYPFDCAPYGYWGPSYFVDGAFIGVGPWNNFFYSYPSYYRPFYFNSGFGFHDGFRRFHGDDHFHDGFRSFHNDGRFRNDGRGYRAYNGDRFRGGTGYRAFNGNGPGFHDGGSRNYNGAGRGYSGGGQSHYSGRSYGGSGSYRAGGSYSGGHSYGGGHSGGGGSRNAGGGGGSRGSRGRR
jgi:hypothetical protein